MNASDIIRMRNANTQFCYLKKNVLDKQPTCSSDSCLNLTGCAPIQFDSYAQKYLLKEGAEDMIITPPPPMYSNKPGFYVLADHDTYNNYQYRFYDGWGPLIDSGIDKNQFSIYNTYYGIGYQFAHFNDEGTSVILQILDSTGIIIRSINYQSTDYGGYYNGERYGLLCYLDDSDGNNKYVLIDPLKNIVYTANLGSQSLLDSVVVITNVGCAFMTVDTDDYYHLYVWNASAKTPSEVMPRFWDLDNTDDVASNMNHYANVTSDIDNYYYSVFTILSNGTCLTYDLHAETYTNCDAGYYGIDNMYYYAILSDGGDYVDLYLFNLTAEKFSQPIIINNVFIGYAGYNAIYYVSQYGDSLTAKNNNFGFYVYGEYAGYDAPFYNATFIAVFEDGSSFTTSDYKLSEYVGINSNGFTLLVYNPDNTTLSAFTITSSTETHLHILVSSPIDTSCHYDIQCANLNDYCYFDVCSSDNGSDTVHYGYIIKTNDATNNYVTYANGNTRGDVYIITSGNSLCRVGTQDTRLTYFNPTSLALQFDVDILYFEGLFFIVKSYPDLASGVIFSLNNNTNSINVLTSIEYKSSIDISPLVFNYYDILGGVVFSDNFNVFAYNGVDGYCSFNIDSNGILTHGPTIPDIYGMLYGQNTLNTIIWAIYANDDNTGLTYFDYNVSNKQYNKKTETNTIYNYYLRTNNYLVQYY